MAIKDEVLIRERNIIVRPRKEDGMVEICFPALGGVLTLHPDDASNVANAMLKASDLARPHLPPKQSH